MLLFNFVLVRNCVFFKYQFSQSSGSTNTTIPSSLSCLGCREEPIRDAPDSERFSFVSGNKHCFIQKSPVIRKGMDFKAGGGFILASLVHLPPSSFAFQSKTFAFNAPVHTMSRLDLGGVQIVSSRRPTVSHQTPLLNTIFLFLSTWLCSASHKKLKTSWMGPRYELNPPQSSDQCAE